VQALQVDGIAGEVGQRGQEAVAVVVGEGQLGAGVRALAAHDHPRSVGPCAELEVVGELGHPGTLARLAVLADRRPPRRFGQTEDRLANALGEVKAHQEVDARGAQLVGELVGGGRAVGANHDRRLLDDDLLRELLKRQLDDLDVV
jgi:hypothetical protein